MERVVREIQAGRFRPVYILFSSDQTLADELIGLLKESLLVPGLEAFDYETISAGDINRSEGLSVGVVLERTRQVPVGAKRRLIVIRHLERMENRALESLCTGLARVPDSTTVVAVCDYDKHLGRIFEKTGVDKWVIRLPASKDQRLHSQVLNWAEKAGLRITPDSVAMLIEIAGEESALLKGEIEKLATALEPNSRVTMDDIRRYASSTRLFELRDYVRYCLDRNTKKALALLHKLERAGEEPILILTWLTYALLDVLAVKSGARTRRSLWRVKENTPDRWSAESLRKALHKLYKINVEILRGYPEPFALLDIWTVGTGIKGDRL
ncbi:MAG: DNA polymerase III subunit delta [bacterium]